MERKRQEKLNMNFLGGSFTYFCCAPMTLLDSLKNIFNVFWYSSARTNSKTDTMIILI